ncbi:MAG: toll/interleukin-1 receptor domain-containing protein, partial [Thermoguttaceae bacterium]
KLAAAISKLGRHAINPDTPALVFLVKLFERSQLVGPSEPYRKPFDAFISHSHSDTITAKKLVVELERAGFRAWLDDREILAGHDIVDEVFRGIGVSDFLLVLLSKAAVASKWVQKELNTGFLTEMDRKQIVVIPVLVEQCEIPEQLRSKKYADLARSWDDGVRFILASLEGHRANRALREFGTAVPTQQQTTNLLSFYQRAVEDVNACGWTAKEAFKDVAIGPMDGVNVRLPRQRLRETIRSCRIGLQNWGGDLFPYDEEMSKAEISNLSNGVRIVDRQPWPFSDWSFFYWRFEENALFAQRSCAA